jgi:hypothetical protein
MKNLADEIAEDLELNPPSEDGLDRLGKLIKSQLALEADILKIMGVLVERQAELKKISEETIPNLFMELHLSEFKLDDGSKVVVKPYYSASISEENKVEAFAWLRSHNLADLIKHEVKVIFGKGEDAECDKLQQELKRLNVNYTDKETVHPQTLKAFVKERMEKMGDQTDPSERLPIETFGVYVGKQTKITLPKK